MILLVMWHNAFQLPPVRKIDKQIKRSPEQESLMNLYLAGIIVKQRIVKGKG